MNVTYPDGYDRSKTPRMITAREATKDDILSGQYREYLMLDAKLMFRRVRVNGAPKTWKTRPDVELPVKYGMYDAFRVKLTANGYEFPGALYLEA